MPEEPSSQIYSNNSRRQLWAWLIPLLFSLSILACYGPVILVPYAFSDDYSLFYNASVQKNFVDRYQVIASGRPLYAFILERTLAGLTDIADLRYVRLAGVAGIIAVGLLILRVLSAHGWSGLQSALIALIICTLPSFQVYAAWATTSFFPYSALLSGLGFIAAQKGLSNRDRTTKWFSLTAAVVLLSTAFAIYQPTAMFFWFFAAVLFLHEHDTPALTLRRFLSFLAIMASAMIVAYVMVRAGQALFPGVVGPERAHITKDVVGKVLWFVREPLRNALNLHNIRPSASAAVALFFFSTCGLMLFLKGPRKNRVILSGVLLLILPLSYLSNLIASHSWFAYRTIMVVGSLVVIYGLCAIRGFLSFLSTDRRTLILNSLLLTAAATCLVVSSKTVHSYFIAPQMTEMKLAREAVSMIDTSRVTNIYVIPSTWDDHLASGVFYDEFGLPSSVHPWSSKAMVALFVRERGNHRPVKTESVTADSVPATREGRTAVIDFRTILRNFKDLKGPAV